MAIWTVDFLSSVTVEASDEDEAIAAAQSKLDDPTFDRNELEFMDFNAWEE